MLLDASTGGSIKNKTAAEIQVLVDNMSLNEYRPQRENGVVVKKQGVRCLETHGALLASNKLLSSKIEALGKKLEAQEVANLSTNSVFCDFCEQIHESGPCLPTSLELSEEQVKYMGVHSLVCDLDHVIPKNIVIALNII